jgi:hypothetical protein
MVSRLGLLVCSDPEVPSRANKAKLIFYRFAGTGVGSNEKTPFQES